jgi:signal transduction histidine kinase
VAGVGLFYALTSLNAFRDPLLFTFGRLALAATVVYMAYVFLCFPRDRLGSKPERWFIEALAVGTAILWTATLALTEKLPVGGALADCGSRCPHNAMRVVSAPEAATSALGIVVNATTAIALIGVAILLVRKARSPVRLRRRAVAPLLYAVIALIASYVGFSVLRESDVGSTSGLWALTGISALAIPATMLFGQIRGRVFAATSLGRIVAKVGGGPVTPTRVQNVIGEVLGDPSLTLALWDPAQSAYVDVRGTRVELPTDPRERMFTPVMRDGRPFAALIHDPALDSSSEVVQGVAATSLMLLENTQLVEELRASRTRIVKTAQHERLRLERDLHDGAQQRLLAIQIKLSQARSRADNQELAMLLEEVEEDASVAVDELRSLAHGIYPTVLRERGLADALRSMAIGAAVPVSVVDHGIGRCRDAVEAAIYFSSLEALQNAVKHAGEGAQVTLTLERRGDQIAFVVSDDGAGFDPVLAGKGIGFVDMRDRVAAVGGQLEISSAPGEGTTVRGAIPDAGTVAEERL